MDTQTVNWCSSFNIKLLFTKIYALLYANEFYSENIIEILIQVIYAYTILTMQPALQNELHSKGKTCHLLDSTKGNDFNILKKMSHFLKKSNFEEI